MKDTMLGTSKQDQIAKGAYNFLAGHGTPAHYHTIARAVYHRRLGIDTWQIPLEHHNKLVKQLYQAMSRHPELFERTEIPGVFWLRGKAREQTYPELE